MKVNEAHQKLIFILLGILITLVILLLTGATQIGPTHIDERSQIGRYRMTTVVRRNFEHVFVIDTVTGVVKWVGDDEGKPFNEIEGRSW